MTGCTRHWRDGAWCRKYGTNLKFDASVNTLFVRRNAKNCHSCIFCSITMRVWALKFYLFDSLLHGFGETCIQALCKDLRNHCYWHLPVKHSIFTCWHIFVCLCKIGLKRLVGEIVIVNPSYFSHSFIEPKLLKFKRSSIRGYFVRLLKTTSSIYCYYSVELYVRLSFGADEMYLFQKKYVDSKLENITVAAATFPKIWQHQRVN